MSELISEFLLFGNRRDLAPSPPARWRQTARSLSSLLFHHTQPVSGLPNRKDQIRKGGGSARKEGAAFITGLQWLSDPNPGCPGKFRTVTLSRLCSRGLAAHSSHWDLIHQRPDSQQSKPHRLDLVTLTTSHEASKSS